MNYSRLWLSLIARSSPVVDAERRKYAELVGNITPDLVRGLVLYMDDRRVLICLSTVSCF